ncbi:hypothetical protein [Sorangium cellulosum]|uniref:hypothetical protein n=1 Tax=Sorangium cellulosum TaxID=56 RepID=UPI0003F8B2FD|nr:hypothetical protein [Sorangium cellulosum]
MRPGPALAGLFLAAAAASACVPATYNVRAARAFANEDARRAIVDDRAADLERAVWLADEVLANTPYSPGDAWVAALRLDDEEGERLRERFEDAAPYDGEHEVPLAKLYRVKLDEALARAAAPRPAPPAFARLFDALAALAARDPTAPPPTAAPPAAPPPTRGRSPPRSGASSGSRPEGRSARPTRPSSPPRRGRSPRGGGRSPEPSGTSRARPPSSARRARGRSPPRPSRATPSASRRSSCGCTPRRSPWRRTW